MIMNNKKIFKRIINILLKILLLLVLVISILLIYFYFDLANNRQCYDIRLEEGTNIAESIMENKMKDGENQIFPDRNLKDRMLVSYSKVVDKDKKDSFLILNYIDRYSKKEFSISIFQDCTIEWQDGHSNAYKKNMIIPSK